MMKPTKNMAMPSNGKVIQYRSSVDQTVRRESIDVDRRDEIGRVESNKRTRQQTKKLGNETRLICIRGAGMQMKPPAASFAYQDVRMCRSISGVPPSTTPSVAKQKNSDPPTLICIRCVSIEIDGQRSSVRNPVQLGTTFPISP